ncbi:hypothetical protein DEO72_LG2g1923 [Vigna unguiculata]|uniref:Uncharacterized protein n=1 Tax=Vigna unguiculata TaxID=3917 RepID=A0A4D6L0W4_VIGUN|nr:hypothetical protein DEO72_LG2g1923 [Vigna unguiculata]
MDECESDDAWRRRGKVDGDTSYLKMWRKALCMTIWRRRPVSSTSFYKSLPKSGPRSTTNDSANWVREPECGVGLFLCKSQQLGEMVCLALIFGPGLLPWRVTFLQMRTVSNFARCNCGEGADSAISLYSICEFTFSKTTE